MQAVSGWGYFSIEHYRGGSLQENPKRSLLVQGWTGINHSYAMVNQYQLIELMKDSTLNLFAQEMSLYDKNWLGMYIM